jgi:predicted PurR-regulated permease PerM
MSEAAETDVPAGVGPSEAADDVGGYASSARPSASDASSEVPPVQVARPPIRIPRSLEFAAAISWRVFIVAAAVIAAFLVLGRLQVVFLSTAAAMVIACALWPLVARLRSIGVPRSVSALVTVLALLSLVVATVALVTPYAADDVRNIDLDVSAEVDEVERWLVEGPLDLSERQVQTFRERADRQLRTVGNRALRGAWDSALFAAELIAGLLLTIVLTFFFLKDGDRMWRWIRGFIPARRRDEWDLIAVHVRDVLAGFLRGTSIVAAVDAIGIGLGLYLLGVPLVIPIALLTFVGGFIPLVGATIAGAVAVLVALVNNGFLTALGVLGVVLLVQQLEGNVLQPFVVGRSVQLHPAVVLVAVGAGAVLWGIGGAVLAVPLTAAASVVLADLRRSPASALPSPPPSSALEDA